MIVLDASALVELALSTALGRRVAARIGDPGTSLANAAAFLGEQRGGPGGSASTHEGRREVQHDLILTKRFAARPRDLEDIRLLQILDQEAQR